MINTTYMGDYDAVIDNGSNFLFTWGDNRDSNGVHANQPDVRRATVAFNPAPSDLGVSGIAAPPVVPYLGNVTYTWTVSRDALPAQISNVSGQFKPGNALLEIQSVATTQGKCYVSNAGGAQCQIGAMASGASVTVTVVAQAVECGPLPMRGTVVHPGVDPNSGNNALTITATSTGGCPTNITYKQETDCAIADVSTVNCPLTIPAGTPIAKVEVGVRLDHTFDADIDMSIVHPNGTVLDLSSDNGGGGDNFGVGAANPCDGTTGYTVFKDSAATSVTAGIPPFAGSYKPEAALSPLIGLARNGVWNLRITDDLGGDVGNVLCWYVKITA